MSLFYVEKRLAERLGVSSALLRKAAGALGLGDEDRLLELCGGKRVAVYSEEGVHLLLAWLADEKNAPRFGAEISSVCVEDVLSGCVLGEDEKEDCAGSAAASEKKNGAPFPEGMELVVGSRRCMNDRLLLCEVAIEDREKLRAAFEFRGIELGSTRLRVGVRSQHNFCVGMRLPVVWVESDYFKCTAPRNPRFRGRW